MEKLAALEWSLKNGCVSIRPAADNTLALQNISGSVAMNGELCSLADARPTERAGADGESEFLFANGVRWIWTARENGNALELVSTLRNESGKPVEIGEWNVLHGRADRDGRIDLGPEPEAVRFFRWKPWDMCVECFAADGNHHSTTLCHLYAPAAKRTALIAFVTLDRMLMRTPDPLRKTSRRHRGIPGGLHSGRIFAAAGRRIAFGNPPDHVSHRPV